MRTMYEYQEHLYQERNYLEYELATRRSERLDQVHSLLKLLQLRVYLHHSFLALSCSSPRVARSIPGPVTIRRF